MIVKNIKNKVSQDLTNNKLYTLDDMLQVLYNGMLRGSQASLYAVDKNKREALSDIISSVVNTVKTEHDLKALGSSRLAEYLLLVDSFIFQKVLKTKK